MSKTYAVNNSIILSFSKLILLKTHNSILQVSYVSSSNPHLCFSKQYYVCNQLLKGTGVSAVNSSINTQLLWRNQVRRNPCCVTSAKRRTASDFNLLYMWHQSSEQKLTYCPIHCQTPTDARANAALYIESWRIKYG